MLRNLDGVILAARGLPEPTVGRPGLTPALRNALAHATAGHYWGDDAIDGVNRLVGYRVFERSPLLGTVGRAESVIFETYRHDEINYLVIATIVTILALIAIAGAIRYQIKLDRARNELRRSRAETRERAQKLELKSRELEITLEYMGQGIIMTDAANNVPVINRRAIELLGLPGPLPIDQPTIEHILKSDQGAFGLEPVGAEQYRKSGSTSTDIQVYQRTLPNGVVLEIHNASLQDGGIVRTISDVTERTHAEEEIVRIAHHDALTGLPNRLLLHDRIDGAIRSARQNKETFAILCLDLDRFKIANDTFGHQAGDGVLKDVAGRLSQCVRYVDTVARVGGDEFVVLQAKVSKPEDVAGMAKRILMIVGAPYKIKGNPLVLGASIGIVLGPRDGASADELLGHANLALYRAKSNGRNDFSFFDVELGQSAKDRVMLELELREALAKDEFEVWYQPWVNVVDRKIAGCEALLRWRHPVRGLIAPIEFIPTAEEAGVIRQLGNLVLRRACRDATTWPTHVKLAINLSAVQFIGGTLSETVLGVLAETGFEAKRLVLEITETLHD